MLVIVYLDEEPKKILDKKTATSILIDEAWLVKSEDLELVADNRDNKYYRVKGTNTVIMHVEQGFHILCDYSVENVNIPEKLAEEHFGVYQYLGRDFVKNSRTGTLIGYVIKELLGIQRPLNTTLDHGAETFNEMEKNKRFITDNINKGSHRVRVEVHSEADLKELIQKIR